MLVLGGERLCMPVLGERLCAYVHVRGKRQCACMVMRVSWVKVCACAG